MEARRKKTRWMATKEIVEEEKTYEDRSIWRAMVKCAPTDRQATIYQEDGDGSIFKINLSLICINLGMQFDIIIQQKKNLPFQSKLALIQLTVAQEINVAAVQM